MAAKLTAAKLNAKLAVARSTARKALDALFVNGEELDSDADREAIRTLIQTFGVSSKVGVAIRELTGVSVR